ncbi:MAG: class I SAM-dependent methyltransferase, partial [Eggerthellaceae bacterium]|nr:class I SAM-dependent methyltransferase [Eggerthellaceae bacterium]
ALLRDALERAARIPELADTASRMTLVEKDSERALADLGFEPAIVLLDPMFPAKHKDSAAKKKLQMLQKLESPCDDEQALIEAAFTARPRKVIVKRPIKGPHLAGRKPSYSLAGKAIRFDVYVKS